MRDFRDAKAMAQTLRDALKVKSISVSHSESLELVARTLGFHDWNVLSAAIQSSQPIATPAGKPPARLSGSGAIIPVVPMRDVVFFPQLISPIFVGREKTRRAIESAAASGGRLLVVTQKRPDEDDPAFDALHSVGVIADIMHRVVEVSPGNLRVRVSCSGRTAIVRPIDGEFLAAEVAPIDETRALDADAFTLTREIFEAYHGFTGSPPPQSLYRYAREPGVLADVVVQLLEVGIEKMQQILETGDVVARLETIVGWMRAGSPAKTN
jgi:ATP-dependent Lon protease